MKPQRAYKGVESNIDTNQDIFEEKNLMNWIIYNGLKANPDKFHLLLSDLDENLSMKVDGFDIYNTKSRW